MVYFLRFLLSAPAKNGKCYQIAFRIAHIEALDLENKILATASPLPDTLSFCGHFRPKPKFSKSESHRMNSRYFLRVELSALIRMIPISSFDDAQIAQNVYA